jgi:uncharacterized protein (TIGR02300 family)
MATKQDRGTKRTCQNGDCGARFYDLNRNPILCPICGSKYAIASSPMAVAAARPEKEVVRKPKKEERVEPVAASEEEAVADDALVDVEADETVADDEDETFLEEEEEDGGDVSTIIGPVEGEEP